MKKNKIYLTLLLIFIAGFLFAQKHTAKKPAHHKAKTTAASPKTAPSNKPVATPKPAAKPAVIADSIPAPVQAVAPKPLPLAKITKPDEKKKPEKDTLHVTIGNIEAVLHNGTGWVKNDYGKWISSPNRIPYEDPDLNNEYYNRYETGKDNFSEMDLMPVSIMGKKYYSLAVRYIKAFEEYKKGGEKEWKCYPAVEYYIIPKEEIKKLRQHAGGIKENTAVNLKYIYYGSYFVFTVPQFIDKMKKRIEWNVTNDHPDDSLTDCYFQIGLSPKKTKTGTILRLNYSLTYPAKDTEPTAPDYTLFDEQYYEIPASNWQAFVGGK